MPVDSSKIERKLKQNGYAKFKINGVIESTLKNMIIDRGASADIIRRLMNWYINASGDLALKKRIQVTSMSTRLNGKLMGEARYSEKPADLKFALFLSNTGEWTYEWGGQVALTRAEDQREITRINPCGGGAILMSPGIDLDLSPVNVSSKNFYVVQVEVACVD